MTIRCYHSISFRDSCVIDGSMRFEGGVTSTRPDCDVHSSVGLGTAADPVTMIEKSSVEYSVISGEDGPSSVDGMLLMVIDSGSMPAGCCKGTVLAVEAMALDDGYSMFACHSNGD